MDLIFLYILIIRKNIDKESKEQKKLKQLRSNIIKSKTKKRRNVSFKSFFS